VLTGVTTKGARASRAEAPDADLLARVRGGDVSALGVLYDRYAEDVRRVLVRLGVPERDVDDMLQETFLDVVRGAKNYDGRANARPWLVGLAVNWVRRRRRSVRVLVRRLASFEEEPTTAPTTPEDEAAGAIAAAKARAALDALSQKKREVFVLVVMEGLPGEEVARLLDIPVATVWTRLHHARRELRAALEEAT
jgi:RNA polymerase sigma-70 factor (ECF subfamily)